MIRFLFLALMMLTGTVFADDRLLGIWENKKEGIRLDILDGFKPNRGAILAIEQRGETRIGYWETTESGTKLEVSWKEGPAKFNGPDTFVWQELMFRKVQGITEDGVVALRQDANGFIAGLVGSMWVTSGQQGEYQQLEFKSTFSPDSGVVETFSKAGKLDALRPWGVSAGVLKVGRTVILEARVSKNYMVGQDQQDEFIVFRATESVSPPIRIDLAQQRSEFLDALVTDTWRKYEIFWFTEHKFRPVEGQLRGRMIALDDNKLVDGSNWEYSPATGVLKIEHEEYVGGMVLGDTLALLDKDGQQQFYKRKADGSGKTFTVSDVAVHKIDETHASELADVLGGQFQRSDYLYSFEFGSDGRTGFIHEWRSIPFTVTAHKLSPNDLVAPLGTETIYFVEDFVIFGDQRILKRDATASRLRAKTEAEVRDDQQSMKERIRELGRTSLVLQITDTSGEVRDIALPFASMAEITGIEILAR